MAFGTITARGSAVTGSGSNSSLSMNPTANIVVGRVAFVSCVTDNSLTADGSSTGRHTVTDSQGNTWNLVAEYTDTDGAVDDGVCVSLWWSKIATQISTGDTITLTPAVNQSDMIISCFEVIVGAGNTVAVQNVGVGQGSLSTSLAGLPSREHLFIYASGSEGEDSAKTPATNYTERFDLISGTSGALDANICLHVATRVQTTTSSGTVASSGWTGTNFMSLLAAMYETADVLPPTAIVGNTSGSSTVPAATIGASGALVSVPVNGSSAVSTAQINGSGALVAAVSGTTSVTGVMEEGTPPATDIVGSTAGASAVTGAMVGSGRLIGALASSTSAQGAVAGNGLLSGAVASVSAATATLSLLPINIEGSVSSISTTQGSIVASGRLIASAAGSSITSGVLSGSGRIIGAASSVSTVSGAMIKFVAMIGSVAGQSTASGAMIASGRLIGSISSFSDVSLQTEDVDPISASISSQSIVSGVLRGTGRLLPVVIAGNSTVAPATLLGRTALVSAVVTGSTVAPATLFGLTSLSAAASAATSVSGVLQGRTSMSTTPITGGSLVTGVLRGNTALIGSVQGGSQISGDLKGVAELVGAIASSSLATLIAVEQTIGELAGLIESVSVTEAHLGKYFERVVSQLDIEQGPEIIIPYVPPGSDVVVVIDVETGEPIVVIEEPVPPKVVSVIDIEN